MFNKVIKLKMGIFHCHVNHFYHNSSLHILCMYNKFVCVCVVSAVCVYIPVLGMLGLNGAATAYIATAVYGLTPRGQQSQIESCEGPSPNSSGSQPFFSDVPIDIYKH